MYDEFGVSGNVGNVVGSLGFWGVKTALSTYKWNWGAQKHIHRSSSQKSYREKTRQVSRDLTLAVELDP
jgi:hypothetical protein